MAHPKKSVPDYIYGEAEEDHSLFQGDIIEVTGLFRLRFKAYYPAITHEPCSKKYAMVLSQSCDLARRKQNDEIKKPNLNHLVLCLIRPMNRTIEFELDHSGVNKSESGLYLLNNPRYAAATQKISRLINNSESKNLFFLPKKKGALDEESVAILNLTYAFRTSCYDEILKNRVASLMPEFRAKIGFLLADYYGRVATTDLLEDNWSDEELFNYTEKVLSKSGIFNIEDNRYYNKCKKIKSGNDIKATLEKLKLMEKASEIGALLREPKKNANQYFFDLIRNPTEIQRLSGLNDKRSQKS